MTVFFLVFLIIAWKLSDTWNCPNWWPGVTCIEVLSSSNPVPGFQGGTVRDTVSVSVSVFIANKVIKNQVITIAKLCRNSTQATQPSSSDAGLTSFSHSHDDFVCGLLTFPCCEITSHMFCIHFSCF